MYAAMIAAANGDAATRDEALKAIEIVNDGDLSFADLIEPFKKGFASGGTGVVGDDLPKAHSALENTLVANTYYFRGRFLILQGQKERGIEFLRFAAGCNSYTTSRAMAVLYLRSQGIDPPKPDQYP